MESNELTEVTRKTDRLIDGEQMTASGRGWLGVKSLSREENGLMDMDSSVVIAGGRR